MVPRDRTRHIGQKPKRRKLYLKIERFFFTPKMLEHWNMLPRGREVSVFGYIKKFPEHGPGRSALAHLALSREGQVTCRGPFQLLLFCDTFWTPTYTQVQVFETPQCYCSPMLNLYHQGKEWNPLSWTTLVYSFQHILQNVLKMKMQ